MLNYIQYGVFSFMHLVEAFIQNLLQYNTVFPGNQTHNLGVASAMPYKMSYGNTTWVERSSFYFGIYKGVYNNGWETLLNSSSTEKKQTK